jgi:inosine-uridine nucleoside N-ribohydrolase
MRRVVLDMDPGIDDAVALLLALNDPDLDVAAVTTVSGNVSVQKGTLNALRIIQALGRKVPVYKGSARPLKAGKVLRAECVHGTDGLGNSGLARPNLKPEKLGAVRMLAELVGSSKKKEISVVATGPLTNIAKLVLMEPTAARKLDRIFVMGGLYDPHVRGNVTEYAEYNFYSDPEAADKVLEISQAANLRVVAAGLEVTSNEACAVRRATLKTISSIGSRPADLACRILKWPVSRQAFNLHDVFALFAMTHQEIFETKGSKVRVARFGRERGRCIAASGSGNFRVCSGVDPAKFNQFLLDGLK